MSAESFPTGTSIFRMLTLLRIARNSYFEPAMGTQLARSSIIYSLANYPMVLGVHL
jgi:hypothetical protein